MPPAKVFLRSIRSPLLRNNPEAVMQYLDRLVGAPAADKDGNVMGQIVDVRGWDRFQDAHGITIVALCVIAAPNPTAGLILP
ncbi:MAG: hypothetical protein WC869_10410 [Phycisphaerae bacterium]|jgi:hypothetical protein